ncbi:MAG: ATP-dependent sacrificial sulfur transferase LarE [Persicimonas sp.]
MPIHDLSGGLQEKVEAILDEMASLGKLVVAYSGGVDSSTVAALAHRALGDDALAVTAVSETLAGRELEEAKALADEIGIRHRLVEFSELDDPRFRENTPARCFFCQSMRFDQLGAIAESIGCEVLASGTNYSDLGDHRPGLEAMEERRVYQPLLEHQIDKEGVRAVARALALSVWDKPAKACLSSRIPHGLEVTDERLRRIERAEAILHDEGFSQFRVRDHDGLARLEVAPDEFDRLWQPGRLRRLSDAIKAAGFDEVTVDLAGYRSGSLNPVREKEAIG